MCIRSHACPSVGWSVSLSRKCLKLLKTSDPGVNLYSCNLPNFIHFHPLSFTFIHFHSPSFIFNFHPTMKTFIKNVHPYILSQPSTHIGLFSQLKRVTLTQQMRVKFQCHTFKQKDDEKGRVYTNTCASRSKKERMNE